MQRNLIFFLKKDVFQGSREELQLYGHRENIFIIILPMEHKNHSVWNAQIQINQFLMKMCFVKIVFYTIKIECLFKTISRWIAYHNVYLQAHK